MEGAPPQGEHLSTSAVRREYPHPPIEEGICQATFAQPLDWSVATPGLLFERMRDAYPVAPEEQAQLAASLDVGQGAPGSASLAVNRGPHRYIFRDESKARLVVANETSISANSLKPYEGWPSLRERFKAALETLESVTPLPPVSQLSIRYINRIEVPLVDGRADTDEYFRLTVRTAEEGRASFLGFLHRVESMLTDGRTRVVSTFATLESNPERFSFLMDLDFVRPGLALGTIDEILIQADELKDLENREFESCITDRTRELFA